MSTGTRDPEADTVDLAVEGMTCASCVSRVAEGLQAVPGVDEARVNLASARATVVLDGDNDVTVDELRRTVEGLGFESPVEQDHGAAEEEDLTDLRNRLILSVVLAVPLVLITMVPPLQFEGNEWVAWALATPIVFLAGWPIQRATLVNLRHGAATMDTLVTLGTTSNSGSTNNRKIDFLAITTDSTLESMEVYGSGPTTTDFFVYEGTSYTGTFNLIWTGSRSIGSTAGWNSSGTINVPLQAGMFYAIGFVGQTSMTYRYVNPSTAQTDWWGTHDRGDDDTSGSTVSR